MTGVVWREPTVRVTTNCIQSELRNLRSFLCIMNPVFSYTHLCEHILSYTSNTEHISVFISATDRALPRHDHSAPSCDIEAPVRRPISLFNYETSIRTFRYPDGRPGIGVVEVLVVDGEGYSITGVCFQRF